MTDVNTVRRANRQCTRATGASSPVWMAALLAAAVLGPTADAVLAQAAARRAVPNLRLRPAAPAPAKPDAEAAKDKAKQPPATAPANNPQQEEIDRKELVAINRKLTGEVSEALDAGRLDDAAAAMEDAASRLDAFVERTRTPQWHRSVATLYQLIDRKRYALGQKLKAAGKPAPASARPKIPQADLKEIIAAKKSLEGVPALFNAGKVSEARTVIEEAQTRLDKAAAASKAPLWHEALAPTYQLLDHQKTALERESTRADEAVAQGGDEPAPKARGGGLQVGDPAPAWTCVTVDNKPIGSKTFAGKWLLIDFWATWCRPCKDEMPYLQEVYEAFGKDDRFAMISLSVDDERNKPRQYAMENGMKWHQGFLGMGFNAPLMKSFGVRGIPALFLIDPDGKIAAVGLRGARIKPAIAKALAGDKRKPGEAKPAAEPTAADKSRQPAA
ncbi:MAG: TlpA family protein disulfide reductase [Phycisphaerae bacterium]